MPPKSIKTLFHSTSSSFVQYLIIVGLVIYASLQGASEMGYNWQWYRVPQFFYQFTNEGFVIGEIPIGLIATLKLSLIAFILALVIGLLIALLRLSDLVVGSAVAVIFLEVIGNTPLLVLFYYVLDPIFNLDRYYPSVLCLANTEAKP